MASSCPINLLERGPAPWETSGAMSTSPDIVSIGEPLIEFNRPKEGDGRTWLQGFGGDSQNVAIAAARQGVRAGYVTSLGQDWMGDAFLELWKSEASTLERDAPSDRADRRQLRDAQRPPATSSTTCARTRPRR
jgi:hypothetical protein